jgi:hypothetical protein
VDLESIIFAFQLGLSSERTAKQIALG